MALKPVRPDLAAARAYDASAPGWASGAELVYRPLARALIDSSPDPWAGRLVLDAGAGTGAATHLLRKSGARVVATDLSHGMLAYKASTRPASFVGDVTRLPMPDGAVDAAVAAFVLNHLDHPGRALRELGRIVRKGGVVLASSFSNADRFPVKDAIDEVLSRHGWTPPDWYVDIKGRTAPATGTADGLGGFAHRAGLDVLDVAERGVDVGPLTAAQLVDYRFGQAQTQDYLQSLPDADQARIREVAITALDSSPLGLAVSVVFLIARAI